MDAAYNYEDTDLASGRKILTTSFRLRFQTAVNELLSSLSRSALPLAMGALTSLFLLWKGVRRLAGARWLALLAIQVGLAFAQSSPFVITGPQISLSPGCKLGPEELPTPPPLTTDCVSIAYAPDSPINQTRYITVPGGNLEFDFPVSSTVPKLIVPPGKRGHTSTSFQVVVNGLGPNPNPNADISKGEITEIFQAQSGTSFTDKGQATIRIPINVDWAESVVTFQITVSEETCLPGSDSHGEPNCSSAEATFLGPDLSAITNNDPNWIGANWPTPLTVDAFLLVATPAAAFQLPFVPTAIVYGPLGNSSNAGSSYGVTKLTTSTEQFSASQDETTGLRLTTGDKTQTKIGLGLGKLQFNYSGVWDDSAQQQSTQENLSGASLSIAYNTNSKYTLTIPGTGQPPLDRITPATQPFWLDVIVGVTNAQYALWDYPNDPIIQPLRGANVVQLPVRQLDSCANAPGAIEPLTVSPGQWAASSTFAPGAIILDSNNNIQVATGMGGVSGDVAPVWNTDRNGSTTTDGSITWTNEQYQFGIYRSSAVQDTARYVWLGPKGSEENTWQANHVYPAGSIVRGQDSIEIATTGGTSGPSLPKWNAADESTTPDGTVIWTNEQEHFIVYSGPPITEQSAYQWLTSDNCKTYLSLDQFYVNKAQSATPKAYAVLGSQLSLIPRDENTFSNEQTLSIAVTDTETSKLGVTSIATNSSSETSGLSLLTKILGLNLTASGSLTDTSSTTMIHTSVDAQTLQQQVTTSNQVMASTTIQDLGSEQSIPVTVLQDAIFMGIAVQDTDLQPTAPPPATAALNYQEALPSKFRNLPVVHVGDSSASLRKNGSPEPTQYVQLTNYGFAMIVNQPSKTP